MLIYIDYTVLDPTEQLRIPAGLVAWPRAESERVVILDGEEFLTVDEAAGLLRIKPATLYAYVSRGLLSSYRQGIKRRRLYRRAEVERLLRVSRSGSAEPAGGRAARALPVLSEDIPDAESWIRD